MAASSKKLKLLVTGGGGMLEHTLSPLLRQRGHEVFALNKSELDVTDFTQVESALDRLQPEMVLHCAAYTQVDAAESEPETAFLVNYSGSENVAIACAKLDAAMVYISTDYVFDGKGNRPYKTSDETGPLSQYGKSKLAGELAVQKHCPRHYILRTSWLYGEHGKNFVDTIYKLAQERGQISVVADQVGSPTSTLSFSEIIADLIEVAPEHYGLYHATDEGATSWFDFAREIVKGLEFAGEKIKVLPIESKDMPRPAPRPAYSVLDKSELVKLLGRPLTPWQLALEHYLELKAVKAPA